ncbi:MAG TPA: hypothetical protein PKM63_22065 [Panacibacter sp.]|nr:hypothetical protein [Panacibacter sp.]HNP47000.1 hypothetical protein [Panacibacter sp.]
MEPTNYRLSKTSKVSIAISIISILITIAINIQIAKEYLRVDGKTRALFGIKELLQFGFQYYVAILGITALIIGVIAKDKSKSTPFAISLSVFAIILVFMRIWELFI